MGLDGAMIAVAVVVLTVLHLGWAFGERWHAANWSFRSDSGRRKAGRQDERELKAMHRSSGVAIRTSHNIEVYKDTTRMHLKQRHL